jgi:hypothetical protein
MNHPPTTPQPAWEALQQPIHPGSLPGGYLRLLSALDTGWTVQEPVIFSPAFYPGLNGTYEFTLENPLDNSTQFVEVQASAEVGDLLRREHLHVRSRRA